MVERKGQRFSETEREEIANLAKSLALLSEDAINDFVINKGRLCLASVQLLNFAIPNAETLELGRKLLHDVAVMEETIRQARAIRQSLGLDETYNLLSKKGLLDRFFSD